MNLPKQKNRAHSSVKPVVPSVPGNSYQQQQNLTAKQSFKPTKSKSPRAKSKKNNKSGTEEVEKKITAIKILIKSIVDQIDTLIQKNHSYILTDTSFLAKAKGILPTFQPLFDEIISIYQKFNACESQDDLCRISFTTLKQISLHVLQKWKEFSALVNLIKNDGYKSLTEYVVKQFDKIERDTVAITTRPRKTCSRTGELLKTGQNIIELMNHNKNAITAMLIDGDIMKNAPDLEETQITDLRNFIHIYNDVAFQMFSFSGYMQTELQAFRTDFNLYCGEIIGSIHCGFSFGNDMGAIIRTCDSFHEQLTEMLQDVKMPEIVIREAQEAKILEESLHKNDKPSIFQEIVDFANDDLISTYITKSAKFDLFIDDISKQLGVIIESNPEITVRLKQLEEFFMQKLKEIAEKETEIDSYIKKIHAQSYQMQEYIQERAESDQLHKEEIERFNKKINDLKEEIKELENSKKKQFDTITHQKQIIYQLRHKNNDETCHVFSKQLGDKMSNIMKEVNDIHNLVPDDGELQDKKRMDVFVLEKRSKGENEYENMIRDAKRKIKAAIDLPKNLPLSKAIDYFIDEYNSLKNSFNSLTEEHARVMETNNNLQDKIDDLLQKIKQKIRELGGECDDDSPDGVINALLRTLDQLRKSYEEKLKEEIQIAKQNMRDEFKELLDLMREIVPDSPNEDMENIFLRKFKVILAKYRTIDYQLSKANALLKHVEKWMNSKTDFETEGIPIEQSLNMMMKAIDEAPNPLQPIVDALQTEQKLIKFALVTVFKRLSEEKPQQNKINPEETDLVEMSAMIQTMIDEVCNEAHAREFVIKQQKEAINSGRATLRKVVEDLAKILMHNEIKAENLEYEQCLTNLTMLVYEICSPEGNNCFIAIETLNQMTYDGRRYIDQQLPPKPSKYIPVMMEQFIKQARTVLSIERLRRPIKELYSQFDFNYTTFDPHTTDFVALRNKVFHLHQVVQQTMTSNIIESNSYVIRGLLALASLFLSSDVALTFSDDPVKSRAKFRDDLELISTRLLQ